MRKKACGMVSGHFELVSNSGSFSVCYQWVERPQSGLPGSAHMQKHLQSPLFFLFFLFFIGRIFSLPKAELQVNSCPKWKKFKDQGRKRNEVGSNEESSWGQQEDCWQLCLVQKSKTENIPGDRWTRGSHGQSDAPIGFQVTTTEHHIFTQTHKLLMLPGWSISKCFFSELLVVTLWVSVIYSFMFLNHPQMKIYLKSWYEFVLCFIT